jgi:hypothetical protein
MKQQRRKIIVQSTLLLISVILLANLVGIGGGIVHAASVTTFSKTYGGSDYQQANSVIQTSDGGYALAGWTSSYGTGYYNFWLVKTDSQGNQQWTQAYGSAGDSEASLVVQTSDGGYALAGFTNSTGNGVYSFWLVKTDSKGSMQWSKAYGGSGDSEAYVMIQTSDGGYLLAGYTTTPGTGGRQILLVKTDSNGNMIWNQTYGGPGDNVANSVIQTSDGGYAIAGSTDSAGAGGNDYYLVKVNANGIMEWSQTYGGLGDDYAYSVVQSSDGGYTLAGYSYSYSDGYNNFWLVKTDSNGNMLWSQTYDGGADSEASSLVRTSDGGYAVAGNIQSSSGEAIWLVKTDASGDAQWTQTYTSSGDNYATSLIQTSDGGYAVAGYTDASGAGSTNFYLIKTTSTGATSTSSAFNWDSLEGFLIIGAIIFIVLGVVLFIMARTRKPTSYPHQ